jgi:hypothetical protein
MWSIARAHSTFTLDLWGTREFTNRSMWAEDRVHLTTAGHRVLASRAAHSLGVAYFELPVHAHRRPRWRPPCLSRHDTRIDGCLPPLIALSGSTAK